MNLIKLQDMLKGMPDQRLKQELDAPSGSVPQYLVLSEVVRRDKVRGSQSAERPTTTVMEDVRSAANQAMSPMAQQYMAAQQQQQMMQPQGSYEEMPQQEMPQEEAPVGYAAGGFITPATAMSNAGIKGFQPQQQQQPMSFGPASPMFAPSPQAPQPQQQQQPININLQTPNAAGTEQEAYPQGMAFGGAVRMKEGGTPPGMVAITTSTGKKVLVAKDYARNFQGLISELEASGYSIDDIGGYSDRNIAGSNKKSEHSKGWSIDINPTRNPVHKDKLVTDMPDNIRDIAKKYGLGWGGDWKSKKDPMHFSVASNEGGSETPFSQDAPQNVRLAGRESTFGLGDGAGREAIGFDPANAPSAEPKSFLAQLGDNFMGNLGGTLGGGAKNLMAAPAQMEISSPVGVAGNPEGVLGTKSNAADEFAALAAARRSPFAAVMASGGFVSDMMTKMAPDMQQAGYNTLFGEKEQMEVDSPVGVAGNAEGVLGIKRSAEDNAILNRQPQQYAGGGVIRMDEGGGVTEAQVRDLMETKAGGSQIGAAAKDVLSAIPRAFLGVGDDLGISSLVGAYKNDPNYSFLDPETADSMTPYTDELRKNGTLDGSFFELPKITDEQVTAETARYNQPGGYDAPVPEPEAFGPPAPAKPREPSALELYMKATEDGNRQMMDFLERQAAAEEARGEGQQGLGAFLRAAGMGMLGSGGVSFGNALNAGLSNGILNREDARLSSAERAGELRSKAELLGIKSLGDMAKMRYDAATSGQLGAKDYLSTIDDIAKMYNDAVKAAQEADPVNWSKDPTVLSAKMLLDQTLRKANFDMPDPAAASAEIERRRAAGQS